MDQIGAKDLDHKTMAERVMGELNGQIDNPGWWAQAVAISYEQEIGRRMVGQRSDGTFEINVSRSTKMGMQELMDKWTAFASNDSEILYMIDGEPRLGGTDKRLQWRAKAIDGSKIQITSEPKKDGTAAIIATVSGIQSQDLSQQSKQKWIGLFEHFLTII